MGRSWPAAGGVSFAGAFSDLLTEPRLFETDFGFFDLRGKSAGLEALFGFLNRSLCAADINVFLLSDLSRYMTGQILYADGGKVFSR